MKLHMKFLNVKKVFVLLGVLLFVHVGASAQINPLKRAQRKLEDRLAKKAADKIEEAIDKKIDEKIDEKEKERKANGEEGDEGAGFDLGKLMGTGKPVDLPDSYDFTFQIDWEINSTAAKEMTSMTQLFSSEDAVIGMEFDNPEKRRGNETMRMVMDMEKKYMIMLDQKEKTAMVLHTEGLDGLVDAELEKEAEKVENEYTVTKTSETKTIAGFSCVKYVYTGEGEESGVLWTTDELSYDNINLYSYFSRMASKRNATHQAYWNKGVKGFVLEMEMVDEKGERTEMKAVKVDENANVSFGISDYDSMDMRGYSKIMGGSKK